MERLQTTTLTAQDIRKPGLVATYTATAPRELLIQLYLSGLAGGDSYRVCTTKQISGAGTAYQSATSAISLPEEVTTAYLSTYPVPVDAGDVVRVYVVGLSADVAVTIIAEVYGSEVISLITDDISEIKAKTDMLGVGSVTVSSPVATGGDVELYEGDDYAAADGRSLEWTNTAGNWPDLTAAAITLAVRTPNGQTFNMAGAVITPTGTQKVRVELTAAQTDDLLAWPTPSDLRVVATLASGRRATLVRGNLEVVQDILA